MSLRSIIMLFLALVCAAAASFGVFQYTSLRPREIALAPEQEEVVILRVDVTRVGTELTADMLQLVKRPKGSVSSAALRNLDDAIGQSVVIPMFLGEPVMPAKLGKGSGLAALVPMGMVAFTFQAPSESSLMAGFAMPNDRVDILLTRDDDTKNRGGKVTQRLVQNVRILSAGDEINRPAGNRVERVRNVTLAVPPGIDQKLAMAQEVGTLALVLRSSPDDKNHVNEPVYLSDLDGGEELALVDRWHAAFSQLANSGKFVASAISNVAKNSLDQEIKRLTDELAVRTRELEKARSGQRIAGLSNKNKPAPTAVLTIRGNSQSYVRVESRAKKSSSKNSN
jgi:pilus assembly protein CpaB